MTNPLVNYAVLGAALFFEGGAWLLAWREFSKTKGNLGYVEAVNRGKDPSLFIVLFEDSAAMLGLLVAMLGLALAELTGIDYFDGIASIVIGLILAGTAVWLAWETKSLLIGESARPELVEAVREIVAAHPAVVHVNEVLTLHMGPEFVLLNLSVDFADGARAGDLESIISALDGRIKQTFPEVQRIFIEAEAREADPASTD